MIYASACIRSSAQSHISPPPPAKNKEGDFWEVMPSDKVKRLASGVLLLSFKHFKHPHYMHSLPCPNHSFTLLLSFLVLVLWLCGCPSCFTTAWIGAFVCILLLFFVSFIPRGKTGKGEFYQAPVLAPVLLRIDRMETRERRKVDR